MTQGKFMTSKFKTTDTVTVKALELQALIKKVRHLEVALEVADKALADTPPLVKLDIKV